MPEAAIGNCDRLKVSNHCAKGMGWTFPLDKWKREDIDQSFGSGIGSRIGTISILEFMRDCI
jgi:hypothetical protein